MIQSLPKLTHAQQEILLETARRLAPHVDRIIHRWVKAYRDMDPAIDRSALDEMEEMYRSYFKMLRVEMDRQSYDDRIAAAAKQLCRMQVSFDNLILSFHLVEESCLPSIEKIYPEKEKLVEAMTAMDYMCHSCFSTIANSYFHEKYTKTARLPQSEKAAPRISQCYELTSREFEVMKRIVDGYRNREIADILKISVKTVEHHRASLMKKLKAHNVVDLVKFAIRNRMA